MLKLNEIHHIAIICSDYERSRTFYTDILGLEIMSETYRADRHSYKLDLALDGKYLIELFSFPNPPKRPTQPEALGLRHLAFGVDDIEENRNKIIALGIEVEPIRMDSYTNKRFTFFKDPDGLPIELYEA